MKPKNAVTCTRPLEVFVPCSVKAHSCPHYEPLASLQLQYFGTWGRVREKWRVIVVENWSWSFGFVKAIATLTGLQQSGHCELLSMSLKYYEVQDFWLPNAPRVRGLLLCNSLRSITKLNAFISYGLHCFSWTADQLNNAIFWYSILRQRRLISLFEYIAFSRLL